MKAADIAGITKIFTFGFIRKIPCCEFVFIYLSFLSLAYIEESIKETKYITKTKYNTNLDELGGPCPFTNTDENHIVLKYERPNPI